MLSRYTRVVLTIFAICLVVLTSRVIFNFPEAQASPGMETKNSDVQLANENGHTWDQMEPGEKFGFVSGYALCSVHLREEAMKGADNLKKRAKDKETINDIERFKKLTLGPSIVSEVSMGQLALGVDSFYKDYRNKLIPICEAIYIVRFSILGASDEKVDKFVQLLRTPVESRGQDWIEKWVITELEQGREVFMPGPILISDADKKQGKD